MINVFLDSNLLYNDPFLEQSMNKRLLKNIERLNGKLFISNIVIQESRNNLQKQLHEIEAEIKTLKKTCNKLGCQLIVEHISMEDILKRFDLHYKRLHEQGIVEIVDTDDDLLPIVVERSIKRIKPFSEKKQEFRDCLIWLSYVRKVEKNSLSNCFLLTNNTSDFYNKTQDDLHEDLKKDSDKFKIYKNTFDFMGKETKLLDQLAKKKILEIVNNITHDQLIEAFDLHFWDTVDDELSNYVNELAPSEVSQLCNEDIDFAEYDGIQTLSIISVGASVDKDELGVLYFGEIEFVVSISLYVYWDGDYYSINSQMNEITIAGFYSFSRNIERADDEYILEGYYDLVLGDFQLTNK